MGLEIKLTDQPVDDPMTCSRQLLVLGLLAHLLAACGPGPGADARAAGSSAGAENDVDPPAMGMGRMMRMMGNMPEGVAPSELPEPDSRGAQLVARYCSQCHGVPTPKRLAAEEWSPTLRRMIVRMERMGRMPMHAMESPSPEEAAGILRYLQRHALRTAPVESLPADDPAAQLFVRSCSRCHSLPDPTQYIPGQWADVVERMRANMRAMDVEEITDDEARRIAEFLERAAAGGQPSRRR